MRFLKDKILTQKVIFQIIIILIFSAPLFSQENHDETILIQKAQELAVSNPDESIKVANHLLKKADDIENITGVNLLLSKSYSTKGDYNKSGIYIFEANKNLNVVSDSLKAEILLAKAEICGTLHLYNQFNDYVVDIEKVINTSGGKKTKNTVSVKLAINKVKVNLQQQKYSKALKMLDSIEKNCIVNISQSQYIALYKGKAYRGLEKYKPARESVLKALQLYDKQKIRSIVLHVTILTELGNLFFQDKEYALAIKTLGIALQEAEKLQNNYLLEDVYNKLAINYLALNNKTEHQKYNKKFITLITTIEEKDTETINSVYNYIGEEEEANFQNEKTRLLHYQYVAIAVLLLIVIAGAGLYYINKLKRRRLKEIISYLEISTVLQLKSEEKKEPNKKMVIPTDTEQNILGKLKKFEASTRFISKDMSLATLSAQLDINSKYLSEIINKHYQDNFNTYINKLRINYIIEKLKNEPGYLNYKISYLADESGFSSHSSFATVFKTITGIAPTTFIDLLSKEVNNKQM